MQYEKVVEYWLITADDDWTSVHNSFITRDYVKALFWGHLYLEKLLKALIVQRTHQHAPHGHALDVLARKAGLEFSKAQFDLLQRATGYNIRARCPDHQFELKKRATDQYCEQELKQIEEFGTWLKSMLKP